MCDRKIKDPKNRKYFSVSHVPILILAIACPLTATAEPVDQTMGNWEGRWTDEDRSSAQLSAAIIAMGNDQYDCVLSVPAECDHDAFQVLLQGQREGEVTTLGGRLQSGADAPTQCHGKVAEGTFRGSIVVDGPTSSFVMIRVGRQPPTLGVPPPAGAVVLLKGNNLDQWTQRDGSPALWKIKGGVMEVHSPTDFIITKQKFRDMKIHCEFWLPLMPDRRGQQRANSGVYVQGRYEVQILDSFGRPPQFREAGGIYKMAVPLANPCLPPGEWQALDITHYAPRLDAGGKMIKPAEMTVVYNGVRIHDKVLLPEPTSSAIDHELDQPGGIMLEDHGDPVRFRNFWVLPLD